MDKVRLGLSQLPAQTALSSVFAYACEHSAKALNIGRVGIWLFVENNSALRCVHLYELARDEHSEGAVLRVVDFPVYFQSLSIQKSVPAELAVADPRTAELAENYMRPLNIASMLDAGLFLDGKLVGVICHEQVGEPRAFTTEDRDFASSMADLVALRMQTAELQDFKAAFQTHEQRLLAGEKAEALAQMAAGVAHDFNNLLTVITGHADMLQGLANLPTEAKSHLEPILEASRRGRALVKELIDFAKPEQSGPLVVNDLVKVMAEFLPVIRSAIDHRVRLDYAKATTRALVLINRTQFCRIVLNLALNARDAMPDGGTVRIRLASVRVRNSHDQSLQYILLEVSDTGTGMEEQTLKRLGEPYFTTKTQGTGLGFAIVRKNVDRAGGILQVESKRGQGTTIRVLFPRVGASTGDTEEFNIPVEFR